MMGAIAQHQFLQGMPVLTLKEAHILQLDGGKELMTAPGICGSHRLINQSFPNMPDAAIVWVYA
jgi:hypothetical protein